MTIRISLTIAVLIKLAIPAHVLAQPMPVQIAWEPDYSREDIRVERGEVADSPYHAFRGTGMVEASIGQLIGVLYDHTRANEWVHQLRDSKALRVDGRSLIVWQRYDNPWPVRDRDFIYFAEPEIDPDNNTFEARFIDIVLSGITLGQAERAAIPDAGCCVRGTVIHAAWIFQAAAARRTCVRVEVVLDPQGNVPASLVNRTQKEWPFATIVGLRQQVRKADIASHPEFGDWTADNETSRADSTVCNDGGDL